MQNVKTKVETARKLSLLAHQNQYVFALADRDQTIIGIKPKKIIRSWSGVERWFAQAKRGYLIGYIGYEQGYRFLNAPKYSVLRKPKHDTLKLPDVLFGVFDYPTQPSPIKGGQKIPPLYRRGQGEGRTGMAKNQYSKLFHRIHHHISIGDIYQANLSYRMTMSYHSAPINVFKTFYAAQPTDYSAYIQTPEFSIASNSPELFLRIHGRTVETRPMKGTRPRSAPRSELLHSAKDKAELAMIVDLHRNDLNRTAVPGSTKVIKARRIVPFSTVWQADAIIQSQIARPYTTLDVIKNCFPAGSITGAPKLRAMEILHELEPVRRNLYTGAIGYIAANGDAEFNVAIRTAIIKNNQLHYHVGGGIVWDSTAEEEYQETLTKARVLEYLSHH